MNLDKTDRRILELLQADAKMHINTLAETLNLSKSPIYERIKRLEQEGIIKQYVALLDTKKVEHFMVVFCSVSLENQKLEEIRNFAREIETIAEVVECYLMGGANDFLLKVIVKDLQAYHQFSSGILAALPNVSQIKSTFVLNEIKHSTQVPLL